MNKPAALITLKRKKTSSYQIRQFAITIDDNVIGKIKSGETKQFKVPVGSHAIGIKIDLYKSEPLRVDLKPDQTLDLECGDRSPENIREAFTLKGMEKSLNSLIKPKQYLYVQQVGNTVPQLTPHSAKSTIKPSKKAPKQRKSCTVFISYRRGIAGKSLAEFVTGSVTNLANRPSSGMLIPYLPGSISENTSIRPSINAVCWWR